MSRAIDPASPLSSDAANTSERARNGNPSSSNGNGHQGGSVHSAGPAPIAAPGPSPVPSTGLVRESLAGKHVCPFCGQQNASANEPCSRCTMEDTAATRQATKARIGPWYVLQTRNPAAPGMKYSTLLALVSKGQVTPRSVVRGPTTHQLWRFAAHVRGLSREFGICYSCGEAVEKTAPICPHCDRMQDPPADADALLEPRGNASSVLGGATGNSHLGGHHGATRRAPSIQPPAHTHNPPTQAAPPPQQQQRPMPAREYAAREFEIPENPPAYVTSRPPRGEHSERLRMFNQEMATSQSRSPRVELARRDMRGGVSGTALATAFQVDPDEYTGGGGGFRRVMIVLLLLALAGGGVYFYLNPQARVKTGAWIQDALANARAKSTATNPDLPVWDSRPKPIKNEPSPNVDNAVVDRNANVASATPTKFVVPELPANVPANTTSNPQTSAPVHLPVNPPATQPATAPAQPENLAKNDVKTEPKVEPKIEPRKPPEPRNEEKTVAKTDPTPDVKTDTKKQAPAEKPAVRKNDQDDQKSPALTDAQAIDRARWLWSQAIDAEAKGDYAEAVRCYEQIKSLPKSAQQAGVDFRLKNARRLAGR